MQKVRNHIALLTLIFVGVAPLGAQEDKKKKVPVAEIKQFRVGFMSNEPGDNYGRYKVGMWTPVYLKIKAGPNGIRPKGPGDHEPFIQIENEDNEDVGTIFRTPFRMEPNEERWVMSYAKPGKMSDIKAKIVIGEQEFRPLFGQANPQQLHSYQFISLGARIPDLHAALATIAKRQQQQFQGQQQGVLDTWPRYAGFETEPGNLPEHWFGYHATDMLILSTNDKEFLLELAKDNDVSRARVRAIAQYVRRGGRLVIPVSPRNADVLYQLLTSTVWQPALPVVPPKEGVIENPRLNEVASFAGGQVQGLIAANRVALLEPAKIVPGSWEVLASSKENFNQETGKPLIARMPYGLGSITYLAFPLDEAPFTTWEPDARKAFLAKLVERLGPRVGNVPDQHQQGGASDLATEVQKSLDNFDVRVIPFGYVALFIIIYIIVVGPLDFLLLKYVVKRLEWTWFTFPTVVLVVSVAAYFTAYAIKGNELKINKVDVIDFDLRTGVDAKGQIKKAAVYGQTFFTILSPRIQNYTIGIEPNPLFWGQAPDKQQTPSADMLSWMGRYDQNIFGGVQRGGGQGFFRKPYRYEDDAAGLIDVPIPVWTTKSFQATWEMTNLAPPLQADLAYFQKRDEGRDTRIVGSLKSSLAVDLEDAWLFYLQRAYPIDGGVPKGGDIKLHFDLAQGKSFGDWLSAQNRDGDRPQTAQGLYNPSQLIRQIQFNDNTDANNRYANHALRALDLGWRLKQDPDPRVRDTSVREAILVARVKFVTGSADALSRDVNRPLPTNIWLGDLPGAGKTRPALAGLMAQDTFVRIVLPVRPKE